MMMIGVAYTVPDDLQNNVNKYYTPACHRLYFVYLLLGDMEMKSEADSNDITERLHDDKPTVGMFVVFLMLYSLQSFLCVWFSCIPVVLMCSLYVLHQHIRLTTVTEVSFDSSRSYFCAFLRLSV